MGPSDGQCTGPHSVHPRARYFLNKLTDTTNWQAGIGFQGAAAPSANASLTYGKSMQNEFPAVSVEVTPISIGNGQMQDFEWRYRASSSSSQTHMEFSTSNPPIHKSTYTIDHEDTGPLLPNNFKISVRAVFRAQRKIRRVNSSFPAKFRFFRDRQLRHLTMTLGAAIGPDGLDHYEFPTKQKFGCKLAIKVDASQGLLGNMGKANGVVQSKLDSYSQKKP